jgi:hypothetical protein
MLHIKTFENYGTPQKFDINGVSVSLLTSSPLGGCEIYFSNIEKVINLGNDTKFAESVFFHARLHAEDGKTEQQVYDIISDKLNKM